MASGRKGKLYNPFKILWVAYIRKNIYPVQSLSNIYLSFHLLWPFVTMKCGCWPWLVCNKKEMISGLNKLWQPPAAKISLLWPLVITNFRLQNMSSLLLQKCANIWPQQIMTASGCKSKFNNFNQDNLVTLHKLMNSRRLLSPYTGNYGGCCCCVRLQQ